MAPLVVGQVGERASSNDSGIANIPIYCLIMSINWSFNLCDHELRDWRIAVRNYLGHLNRVVFCELKEEVPVASISCVEIVPVKVNAGQSKS